MEVLQNLVLPGGTAVLRLVDKILDAGVCTLGETEVELEGEILILLHRDNVAASAELGVLGRKFHPRAVGGDAAYREHRERAVLHDPALRRELRHVLRADPAGGRLAVPEELPAVGLLGRRERVRICRRGLHLRRDLDRSRHALVVAKGLGQRQLVVLEVLLVFDKTRTRKADLRERGHDRRDVELAARTRHGQVLDGVDEDVLEMDLIDALGVFLDRLDRIVARAALMADVETEAETGITVLDAGPDRFSRREQVLDVRPVIVNTGLDVVFLDVLLDDVKHRIRLDTGLLAVNRLQLERDDRDGLQSVVLRELEQRRDLFLAGAVERTRRHDLDAVLRGILLERRNLRRRGVTRQRALDEAKLMAIHRLHELERLRIPLLVHRKTGDADLIRHLGKRRDSRHGAQHEHQFLHCI